MTKKRILTIVTTLIMVLLLTAGLMACGKKDSDKTDKETSNQVTEVATDNNATPTETVIPTPTDVPTTSFEVIEGEDGEQEVIISDATKDDVTTNEEGDTVVIIDDVEVKVETKEDGSIVVKDETVSDAVKDTVNNQESDKDSDGKETGKVEIVIGKDENGEVAVSTPTPSPSATPIPTKAPVATNTPTPVVTKAPTNTATPTKQVTATPTVKATSTPTPVATKAPVPTATKAQTATPTKKPTVTPTKAPTATPTPAVKYLVAEDKYTYEDFIWDAEAESKVNTSKWNQYLADEINKYRNSLGLNSLVISTDDQKASILRSKELIELFSHIRPNGGSCDTVFQDNGLTSLTYGEIIATDAMNIWIAIDENMEFATWDELSEFYGKYVATVLVTRWKNSSSHNDLLINTYCPYMGCSVAYDGVSIYGHAFIG